MLEQEEIKPEISSGVCIVLKKKFKDKIDYLSTYYDKEIGGFFTGTVDKKGGVIVVDDLLIPEQEVGNAHVDYCPKDLINLRKEFKDECMRIIGNWHSHNTMDTFWSSTDEEEMNKKFSEPREITLFIVSSKGKHKIQMVITTPFNIVVDNLPYLVETDASVAESLKEEIGRKVKEVTYSTTTNTGCQYVRDYDDRYSDKKLKREINKRIKFFNKSNTVLIDMLYHNYARAIEEEFKTLNPIVEKVDAEHSKVTVVLDTKDKAKEFMIDVKAFILVQAKAAKTAEKQKTLEDIDDEEFDDEYYGMGEYEDHPSWRNGYGDIDVRDYRNYFSRL